jgi:hypothetical protein
VVFISLIFHGLLDSWNTFLRCLNLEKKENYEIGAGGGGGVKALCITEDLDY